VQPAVKVSVSSRVPRGSIASPQRILFVFIALLSLGGVIVSAVSCERHYAKSATQFCDFSEKFSCDIVNRSQYSAIMGVPVAGIGVVGYAVLFWFSTFWKSRPETPTRLLAAAVAGLGFASYLTYIEAYVLTAWCILCVVSMLLISLITVLAVGLTVSSSRA
jgi:vitamin-K-epoxide reductase (warfarin-sensitive)